VMVCARHEGLGAASRHPVGITGLRNDEAQPTALDTEPPELLGARAVLRVVALGTTATAIDE